MSWWQLDQLEFALPEPSWRERAADAEFAAFNSKSLSVTWSECIAVGFQRTDVVLVRMKHRPTIARVRSGWPLLGSEAIAYVDLDRLDQPLFWNRPGGYLVHGGVLWPKATGTLLPGESLVNGPVVMNAGKWYCDQRLIPLCPIWPGFAINTLFYAGVLWMLCCGPFALRRMIRRRRGRCPQCGYPIGQSPVCTECGAPHSVVPAKAGTQ